MREEYEKELREAMEANQPTTFTNFEDLIDCFEAIEDEEEIKNQPIISTKCPKLLEDLDILPDRLSKPEKYFEEWRIMEQVWYEEHRRITIEHIENCEFCQTLPPKKLQRCEECNTIESLEY